MENSPISFPCPACGTKLTVPAHLAGVTGPCPSCSNQIQAPDSPQKLKSIPLAALPTLPSQAQTLTGLHPSSSTEDPLPPIRVSESGLAPTRAVVEPELGQLLDHPSHVERATEPTPKPARPSANKPENSPTVPNPSQKKSRFTRLLFFLLFIAAAVTIGSGVVSFLRDQREKGQARHPISKISVRTISPRIIAPHGPPDSQKPPEVSIPILPISPVPPPDQPVITAPPPSLPDAVEPQTPSQAATEVLNKFLAAKTLQERLPLVETQTPETVLAKSCLADPFPMAKEIFIETIENNSAEQAVNYYHHVTFDTEDPSKELQTILIQKRGTSAPRVIVDPFLDSYGGRLAAYAKKPSDQPGTFRVTILPQAACTNEAIPNRENKLTLKLLAQDDAKEITLAYFTKESKIAQMLEDGTYSLSYGKAKACTVILRWNQEERPEAPYLEVVTLKTLDWNP
jgi:hypothetical protein